MALTTFRGTVRATEGFVGPQTQGLTVQDVATGIVAAGSNSQANATELSAFLNVVATVSATTRAVKLPAAAEGLMIAIHNTASTAVKVYPNTGDKINAASTNAVGAQTIAQNKGNIYIAQDDTTWRLFAGA